MSLPPMPTPADLEENPELAALAVLGAALEGARAALLAGYVDLRNRGRSDGRRYNTGASAWAAEALVLLADVMTQQIASYREALKCQRLP